MREPTTDHARRHRGKARIQRTAGSALALSLLAAA